VYVGAFPRHDYYDLNYENIENDGDEDMEGSQPSAGTRRRSALHELCHQCKTITFDDANDSEEDKMRISREKAEIYNLARNILRASHCSENRNSWGHRFGHSLNNSLLTMYVADQTPLHILCAQSNVDIQMISILLEAVSLPSERRKATIRLPHLTSLFTSRSRHGCNPLHYLVGSCSADEMEELFSLMESMLKDEFNSLSVAREALKAAFLTFDSDMESPLHWALHEKMCAARFRILLKYSGIGALFEPNLSDEFPFDQFSRSCEEDLLVTQNEEVERTEADNFRQFVELLSVVMETSYHEEEKAGRGKIHPNKDSPPPQIQPLHHLASYDYFPCPAYMFQLALRYHGDDIMVCDNSLRGRSPLHLALSAPQSTSRFLMRGHPIARSMNEANIAMLLEHDPNCATLYSREGRAPLHYAVESQSSIENIRTLLKIYPAALSVRDPLTDLHPMALAAVGENNTLDVIFELGRLEPSNFVVN